MQQERRTAQARRKLTDVTNELIAELGLEGFSLAEVASGGVTELTRSHAHGNVRSVDPNNTTAVAEARQLAAGAIEASVRL